MKKNLIKILFENHLISAEDIPIYEYGLWVLLFNSLCISIAIVIGTVTKNHHFSILFFLFYTPIRILLGGFHCKTPLRCILFFEMLFSIVLLLKSLINITRYGPIIWILTFFAYFLLLKEERYFSRRTIILFFILMLFYLLSFSQLNNTLLYSLLFNLFLFFIDILLK